MSRTLPRGPARLVILSASLLLTACASKPAAHDEPGMTEIGPPPPEIVKTPCIVANPDEVPVLDMSARMLAETLCDATLWLDGVLGGAPDIQAARRSHGRVELGALSNRIDGTDTRARLRVDVDLASTQRRLGAFFGLEDDEEFVQDRDQGYELRTTFPSLGEDRRWLAGLGYSVGGSDRFRTNFDVGARGASDPEFFARLRMSLLAVATPSVRLKFRLTPFWTDEDLFGATAAADLSHVLAPTRLLRWSLLATRADVNRHGADWRAAIIFYQNLRRRRGLASQFYATGESAADEPLREYGIRELYRHPLFENRLYLEIIAGYFWRQDDPAMPRVGAVNGGLILQMPFGESR